MDPFDKAQLLNKITENVPGVIYQFQLFPDGRVCFPFSSTALIDVFGINPDEVVEDAAKVFALVHAEDLEKLNLSIWESARLMHDWDFEFRVCHPMRGTRWIHGFSRPEKVGDGSILWHGFLNDITERKSLEEKLLKASRLNLLNGKINSMIIHANDHIRLFKETCEILVLDGEFKMAWVGLLDQQDQALFVACSCGDDSGYLEEIGSVRLGGELLGPSARSVLEKRAIVNNDTLNNPEFARWRSAAQRVGYLSSISLPLVVNNTVIGNLNIYTEKVNYFNPPEIKLLEEIAQNVSYAVSVIDKEKALSQSELSFRTIFEESPLGIALIDSHTGRFHKINSSYLEILGLSLEEMSQTDWMSVTHPDDVDQDLAYMKQLIAGEIPGFKMVKRYIRKDGTLVWVEISVVPFYTTHAGLMQHLCMVENITDRIRYEEELRTALKVRDEFLSIASHELKTPITSLKLQVQLLSRDLQRSEAPEIYAKHAKALDMASRQTDRLTFLVDNLLDVTRVEAGQFNIKPVKFNLSQVLSDTIDRFQGLLQEASCELMSHIHPDILGYWDQGRIEQVLVNLLSNAIKYAPQRPIVIKLYPESEEVVFKITDHGPGLTESDKTRIFRQFERVSSAINISGLGLGLYISKKIVDSHQGEILVESEEGRGTTFTVKLPLRNSGEE